jgi:hypothetical protein
MFGISLAKPSQESESGEEYFNNDDEDADAVSEQYEDVEPSTDLDEWHGIPVIGGIDSTISNHGSGLEPVSNLPSPPRPARRSLPAASISWLDNV